MFRGAQNRSAGCPGPGSASGDIQGWTAALAGFGGGADPTRGAQNCTITYNTFSSNVSEGLFYSSSQFPGTVSTNVAHNNNFEGNGNVSDDGVFYGGTETLNVTCNWWNHIGGPDHPTNPNPPADDLAAASATFTPWLLAPAPGGPCDGPVAVQNLPWGQAKALYR